MDRRTFLLGGGAVVIVALGGGAYYWLKRPKDDFGGGSNAKPTAEQLAVPNPLGEMALGDPNAPVTFIEYASMTCPHCAHFQEATFPELKKQYIDTGKVRYLLREFPLDLLAAAGFMLARCASKDGDSQKYFGLVDLLFSTQRTWAVEKPYGPMLDVVKQTGFTKESFESCLANQKMLDGIQEVRDQAAQKFGVKSTPTFFINGKKVEGDVSFADLEKEFQPYLKA